VGDVSENLVLQQRPELGSPRLVAASAGWPDAAESATRAVSFLREHLGAVKLAEIRPDTFFDLTDARPKVIVLARMGFASFSIGQRTNKRIAAEGGVSGER